jgi:hypothetical protein
MRQIRIFEQVMLAAACLAIPTEAYASSNLFERATCSAAGYSQCASIAASFPPNFCCPANSNCIALAGNTTLLCCPTGQDCSLIQPIACDVSLQNATSHPNNILKTTALSVPLAQCAGQCCPFGFSCDGTNCILNKNQDSVPSAASSTSTTVVPTSPAKPASTSTNPTAALTASCNKFPVTAILVGFFPGLALGVLSTIACVCLLGARRRNTDRRRSGSSFGNISEPQPVGDMRTDFLRKPPQTPSSSAGSRLTGVHRVRSLFRKSTVPNSPATTGRSSPRQAPPIPTMAQKQQARPVTPPLQRALSREPSYEDINIFADGHTASSLRERQEGGHGDGLAPPMVNPRESGQTTFTDLMERSGLAGLSKGQRKSSHLLPQYIRRY